MTSDWKATTIGEVATWRGGLTPSKNRVDYWSGGRIPWISSKEVSGGVLQGTEHSITDVALHETALRLVAAGSVAIVVRSGILIRHFPVAYVPFEVTVNQDVKIASPNAGVDGRFLRHLLDAEAETILARYRRTGTTVQSINFPALLQHPVRLPPLTVQRRIVDLIGSIDMHLRSLGMAQADLGRLSTAVHDACTDRAREAGIFLRVDQLLVAPATYGVLKPGEDDSNGVLLIRGQDIREGRVKTGQLRSISADLDREYARSRVQGGDLVLTLVGTPGEAAIVPDELDGCNISRAVGRLRVGPVVVPEFLLGVLRSSWGQDLLRAQVRGAVQQMINLRDLRQLQIPVPDLDVQRELADSMGSATAALSAAAHEAEMVTVFRNRLLSALLSRDVELPEAYDRLLDLGVT